MTGCLYTSPPADLNDPDKLVIPTIYADTIATWRDAPGDAVTILPMNYSADLSGRRSRVSIVRKLTLMGTSAFALAGEERYIRQTLTEISHKLDELRVTSRPMRWVGDAVNGLNAQVKADVVALVGCQVNDDHAPPVNFVTPKDPELIGAYGRCGAAGSGADDLLNICRATQAGASKMQNYVRSLQLGAFINGERHAREMMVGSTNHWGGYMEMASYVEQQWQRGPDALHLFARVQQRKTGKSTVSLVNRAIAYANDGQRGRILASEWRDGGTTYGEFVLSDVLQTPQPPAPNPLAFWQGWRPQSLIVTTIVENGSQWSFNVSLSHDPNRSLSGYHFEVGGNAMKMGLDADVLLRTVQASVRTLYPGHMTS